MGWVVFTGPDARDTCYVAGLGFHQEDVTMTCNSCGRSLPIKGLGTSNVPGGCWPSHVPFEIQDDLVPIDAEYLDRRAYMFDRAPPGPEPS